MIKLNLVYVGLYLVRMQHPTSQDLCDKGELNLNYLVHKNPTPESESGCILHFCSVKQGAMHKQPKLKLHPSVPNNLTPSLSAVLAQQLCNATH